MRSQNKSYGLTRVEQDHRRTYLRVKAHRELLHTLITVSKAEIRRRYTEEYIETLLQRANFTSAPSPPESDDR